MIQFKTIKLVIFCSVTLFIPVARAQVFTYNPPEYVTSSTHLTKTSDEYRVELYQGGKEFDSFVYMMNALQYTNKSLTTSWTSFSFADTVTVRVYKLKGKIDYCAILPSSKKIVAKVADNYVEFNLSKPGQFSVEFERGIIIKHPMLVFANSPEKEIPSPNDPGIVYFGPGLHDLGEGYNIPSGKKVYIDGGAFIKGRFTSTDTENVTIFGRGVLSGEEYPVRGAGRLIQFRNVRNALVEGITVIQAPSWNVFLSGENNIIRNVKMMGWWFSTDGADTGENGIVEDCFFKVNDDACKVYENNTIIRRCVIWQMENGAPFQIGWGGDVDVTNFHVYDCDVIRTEHIWDNENIAVFCAIHGERGHKSQFLFEDIRVENSNWRVFHIITKPNRWATWDPERGNLSDITFRNITVNDPQRIQSLIKGHDEFHKIWNITFENLKINGKLISNKEESDFIIDPETTGNIQFKVTNQ